MGGDRGSARAGHGHSQKPECEQENTLTTHPRTRGCWDCEPGSSHDAAAAEAATMSGGHGWRRAPQSLPRPQVRGSDPARPGREQRPLGRTAGSGQRSTVRSSPRALLPRSSCTPSPAGPPPQPTPGSDRAPTPPARPVAPGRPSARRPLGGRPRLTFSRLRRQGRNNSARRPRPTRRPRSAAG